MVDLGIKADMTLPEVLAIMDHMPFGSTDCAVPMKDAMELRRKDIDVFIVYTDCETW